MIKTDRNQIIYFFISIFIMVFSIISSNIILLSILSILSFATCFMMIFRIERSILSLPILFLMALFVFHCGQFVVYLFGFENLIGLGNDISLYLNVETQIVALKFTILSEILFSFGLLLSEMRRFSYKETCSDNEIQINNVRLLGVVLFVCSFPCRLYIDINKFLLYLSGAYISTYSFKAFGLFSILNEFFVPSIMLLIIGNCKNERKCRRIVFFTVVYCFFSMLKGNRALEIITILTALSLYFALCGKPKIKPTKLVLYGLVAYFFLVLLNIVGGIRTGGDIFSLNTLYLAIKEGNPLTQIMKFFGEMGGSMLSLGYAVKYIPSTHSYMYGTSYLFALFSIYPNIGGLLGSIVNHYSFLNYFPVNVVQYMGGSVLGEAYVNFGFIFGILFMFVVGIIMGKIHNAFRYNCETRKNYYTLAIISVMIPSLIFWARDFFYSMIFQTFWVAVLLLIIANIKRYRK